MKLHTFRDRTAFFAYLTTPLVKERQLVEQLHATENALAKQWRILGFCQACQRASSFLMDWNYSSGDVPNYRERAVCRHCQLNNRQRFMLGYVRRLVEGRSTAPVVYCSEQTTGFYSYLSQALDGASIIGSEYLGSDRRPGETVDGIRHETALELSFASESIDVMVSNDVFEHVPDIEKALSEARRVLKGGGRLLFSVPFYVGQDETTRRATLVDGLVEHLLPPEYHADPLSEGSLVYYGFGWDLLETCRSVGFKDAYMLAYYSLFYGYLGGGLQYMFIAER